MSDNVTKNAISQTSSSNTTQNKPLLVTVSVPVEVWIPDKMPTGEMEELHARMVKAAEIAVSNSLIRTGASQSFGHPEASWANVIVRYAGITGTPAYTKAKSSVPIILVDRGVECRPREMADAPKTLPITVESTGGQAWISADGYNDMNSHPGERNPVIMLEVWAGRFLIHAWTDINREDPIDIAMEGAHEDQRELD